MSLRLEAEAYAVLQTLAGAWGVSRTDVLIRLIMASKGKRLKIQ